jgi:hypothetical protein
MPPDSSSRPISPDPACLPERRALAARRFLPERRSLEGTRPVVPVMRRELVTAHMLQASMTTKPATAIRMTLITTPASSSRRRSGTRAPPRCPGAYSAPAGRPRGRRWQTAGRRHESACSVCSNWRRSPSLAFQRDRAQAAQQAHLPPTAQPAAARQAGSRTPGWLIASAAAIAAASLACTALRLHRYKPATVPDSQPGTRGSAAGSAKPGPGDRRHAPWRLPKAG